MSGSASRVFEDAPAERHGSGLIIGLTGPSTSGKTFSGLRLASGIQRALGGDIYGVDTEARRMLHYADYFKFRHVPFDPPHGPLDYIAAIDHCAQKIGKGRGIVLIDSMTHEHDGEGGVLEQIENFLEQKAGNDYERRNQFLMVAQVKPKRERKALNRRIVQLGNIVFILCYRAEEKIKPLKRGEKNDDGSREPKDLGWQPTTTSKLPYDMTVRFLLTPGCEGVPSLIPPKPEEKKLVKQPRQFKDWFKEGEALSEVMGERLAVWALGKSGPPTPGDYEACTDRPAFDALEQRRADVWKTIPPSVSKDALKKASDAAKARLASGAAAAATNVQRDLVGEQRQPFTEESALAHIRAQQQIADVDAAVSAIGRDFASRGEALPPSIEPTAHDRKEALQQY